MSNLISDINVNEKLPTKEFKEALKELDYMESHIEGYEVYHDVDKMFKDILNKE